MLCGKFRNYDQVVRIRHPGYDDSCNVLLTLYGLDHPDGGIHSETARTACGILAGNRWDGVLSPSATKFNGMEQTGPYFIGRDAYFHLPDWQPNEPDDPDAQLKRRYPIYVRLEDWPFPHGSLPKIWQAILSHPPQLNQKAISGDEDVEDAENEDAEDAEDAEDGDTEDAEGEDVEDAKDEDAGDAGDAEDEEVRKFVTSVEALFSICDPQGGDIAAAALAQQTGETSDEEVPSIQHLSTQSEGPDENRNKSDTESSEESMNASQNEQEDNSSGEDSSDVDDETWCQLCNSSSDDVGAWYLTPLAETRWFQDNQMWRYLSQKEENLANEPYEDIDAIGRVQRSQRGLINLEENCFGERHSCDIVDGLLRGQWVFAPKFEWCGSPKLVAQLFAPQFVDGEYWDQGIDTSRDNPLLRSDQLSLEIIFVRFACSVFYNLGDFLQAGVHRMLIICDQKGTMQPRQITASACADLCLRADSIKSAKLRDESLRYHDDDCSLTCDGCGYNFSGVRFKCLDCEDFDYCSFCIGGADTTHPGQSFIKLYQNTREEDQAEQEDEEPAIEADESVASPFSSSDESVEEDAQNLWQVFLTSTIDSSVEAMKYSPLAPPTEDNVTIRLFTLWPESNLAPLSGHLWTTDLKNAPAFEGLSYCWGEESTKTSIMISGGRLSITQNLKSALQHLRHPSSPRTLWIDAICINQEDSVEKARQVSKMTEIFCEAQQVIIWLGDEADKSGKAIQMCRRILKEAGLQFWKNNFNLDLENFRGGEAKMQETIKSLLESEEHLDSMIVPAGDSAFEPFVGENDGDDNEPLSLVRRKEIVQHHLRNLMRIYGTVNIYPLMELLSKSEDEKPDHGCPDDDSEANSKSQQETSSLASQYGVLERFPHMFALQAIFRRPWFRRVWIIQEAAAANTATIMCGREQINWWLLFYAILVIAIKARQRNQLLREPGLSTFIHIASARMLMSKCFLNLSVNLRSPGDLLSALQTFRRFNATNQRDKVYALLGLLPPNSTEKTLIFIDYKEDVVTTYIRTALILLKASKNLDILATPKRTGGFSDDLPSWVPDWSDTGPYAQVLFDRFSDSSEIFKATAGSQLDSTLDIGRDDVTKAVNGRLLLRGYIVDYVKTLRQQLEYDEKNMDFLEYGKAARALYEQIKAFDKSNASSHTMAEFRNATTNFADKVRRIIRASKRFADNVENWRALALENEDEPYLTGENKMKVFKRTLAGGVCGGVYQHGWEVMESSFDQWWEQMGTWKLFIEDLSKNLPENPKDLGELLPWFRSVLGMYQSNSYLGLFQRRGSIMKNHDVLQKALFRKLGKMEKGYLGLLPGECKEGDSVVLLKGGKTPYIVRQRDEGWQFVGDCYIHGMMNGEAWDELKCHDMAIY